MQLTAPYSLYTLLLVQCILAACIQAAALPAALPATLPATADTERLLQQLSEMEDSPPQEHRSRSERGAVLPDHNYAQTVIDRREFWRYQDCQQKFNCGKISWQHCTDQPAKVSSLDACKSTIYLLVLKTSIIIHSIATVYILIYYCHCHLLNSINNL